MRSDGRAIGRDQDLASRLEEELDARPCVGDEAAAAPAASNTRVAGEKP